MQISTIWFLINSQEVVIFVKKILLAHPIQFIATVIFKIISSALWVGFAVLMQYIVNAAISATSVDSFSRLIMQASVFCLVIFASYFLNQLFSQLYINRCLKELRESYTNHLLDFNYERFSKKGSASYISAMTNDITIIQEKYFSSIFLSVEDITSIITTLIVMFYLDKTLGLILIGMTCLLAILPATLKRTLDTATKNYSNKLNLYTANLKDAFMGFEIIKAFTAEKKYKEGLSESAAEVRTAQNKLGIISNVLGMFSFCLSQGLSLILMIIVAWMVINKQLDVGAIVAVLNLSLRFFKQVQNVASHIMLPFTVSKINKEIMSIIHGGDENRHAVEELSWQGNQFDIELRHVSFGYRHDKPVLKDINIRISPGEKWLVLGESGSGKSTLLKLIAKMYESYEGEISIGGHNYKRIDGRDLAKNVTLVSQRCYLFNSSLKDNINILGDPSEKQLQRAIELAQLKELVDRLPDQLDSVVDEEVNQLSGGEKMRVNLARALYINPQVLLLDEVTSALDRCNSQKIENMILNMAHTSVINVCHKFDPHNLEKYDNILIIENGSIVQIGAYHDLKNSKILNKYREEEAVYA